jgi:CBS domain-containing protein
LFGTSWRVARIAGIEVRVDSSWVVIALLITYSMYLRFSVLYKDLSTGAAVGIAILAAVLFFGSVLVHELAHALVSRARGIRVQDITLFLFGGATRARVESRGPGDEFLIAAVGPLDFMRYDHSAFPVDEYGRTIGLLTLRKVRRMPSDQWPTSRVRDHMAPLDGQVVVPPDAPMDQVMAKLQDGEAGRVLAAEDGEVVGIITPSDLTRWLRRWRTLDGRALDSRADSRNLDRRY